METTDNVRVGDLVKRLDIPGTGTGIVYRVLSLSEEKECDVLRRGGSGYNSRVKVRTRLAKLSPVIVMFESKVVTQRSNVSHHTCDLRVVDLVAMGTEYVKLGNLISDEARRLARGTDSAHQ